MSDSVPTQTNISTTVNQELLFWSVLLVFELIIIFVLVPGFFGFLALLAIAPIIWWPVRDSLRWPLPKQKPAENSTTTHEKPSA